MSAIKNVLIESSEAIAANTTELHAIAAAIEIGDPDAIKRAVTIVGELRNTLAVLQEIAAPQIAPHPPVSAAKIAIQRAKVA